MPKARVPKPINSRVSAAESRIRDCRLLTKIAGFDYYF